MHKAFLHCLQATHNSFIWLPNGIGAGLGLLQLGLCLIFKQKARYAYRHLQFCKGVLQITQLAALNSCAYIPAAASRPALYSISRACHAPWAWSIAFRSCTTVTNILLQLCLCVRHATCVPCSMLKSAHHHYLQPNSKLPNLTLSCSAPTKQLA